MKHSAHAPYDLSSIALRATDDEKRKMRVVFANIPCLCYIIQWKGKISWKKLQIALKEANETSYWLLLLEKTNILSSAECDRLETLCREIRITLTASINTTKQNLK